MTVDDRANHESRTVPRQQSPSARCNRCRSARSRYSAGEHGDPLRLPHLAEALRPSNRPNRARRPRGNVRRVRNGGRDSVHPGRRAVPQSAARNDDGGVESIGRCDADTPGKK